MASPKACECCEAIASEVDFPLPETGEPFAACFLCAHMLTEHEIPLAEMRRRIFAPIEADVVVYCPCDGLAIFPADHPRAVSLRAYRAEQRDAAALARVVDGIAAGRRVQPVSGHARADGREVAPYHRCDPVRRRV